MNILMAEEIGFIVLGIIKLIKDFEFTFYIESENKVYPT